MESTFQSFTHNSSDLILAVHYDFYGTRLATASSDHTLKVWNKNPLTSAPSTPASAGGQTWELCDSWRGHDAEVTDVKWAPPFTGTYLASISEDCSLKIWYEDPAGIPNSGRRFRLCTTSSPYPSPSLHPFSSIAFASASSPSAPFQTYLALTTRDGILLVLEPRDHETLAGEWLPCLGTGGTGAAAGRDFSLLAHHRRPARGAETCFSVVFHGEKVPLWTAVQAGLERRALSLACAAMDCVKVYRTDRERRLYLAAVLEGAGGREGELVRGIAWGNGSMRGWDTIAAGGKDGVVRVWELRTPDDLTVSGDSEGGDDERRVLRAMAGDGGTGVGSVRRRQPHAASLLSSDLARHSSRASSMRKVNSNVADDQVSLSSVMQEKAAAAAAEDPMLTGRVPSEAKLAAELVGHKGAVWRVGFSFSGELLTSTGDDGFVKAWKRGYDGTWCEWAQVDVRDAD